MIEKIVVFQETCTDCKAKLTQGSLYYESRFTGRKLCAICMTAWEKMTKEQEKEKP